ncbi:hypothetical protein [Actinoallomurus soli]|uniref:hypothetical protein n=1 Tax=Actinoallomurus soli TaxID=2952535 RepID=UPI0020936711|nr:hypothetical protein [Actinoallomurus soli]MCO5968384.1 hypothetical protein [Actinoallomurus soli]
MRPPAWFRLMRAGVFAAVCVVLSVTAHGLMHPRPVPAYAAPSAFAALTGVGFCLADRRRSVWWLLLAVEVVQGGLHLWFSAVSAGPAPGLATSRTSMPGMHHLVPGVGHPDHLVPGLEHPGPPHAGTSGWGMLIAHLLAGVLVAVWLSAGERAAWRALTAMTRLLLARALRVLALLRGVSIATTPRGAKTGRGRRKRPRPQIGALRHTVVRRGPPAYERRASIRLAVTAAG